MDTIIRKYNYRLETGTVGTDMNDKNKFYEILLTVKTGDVVTFGRYPQTAAGDDKTPIEWYVIKIDGESIMLLSKYILDCMPINEGTHYITWPDCSLRKWLNQDFYLTAFDEEERAIIALNGCKNNGRKLTRTEPGYKGVVKVCDAAEDTEDYVFLLSDVEVNDAQRCGLDRRKYFAGIATEFVKQRNKDKGLIATEAGGISMEFVKHLVGGGRIWVCEENGFSQWWTRTRSDDRYRGSFQTMYVRCDEGEKEYPYCDEKFFEDHVGEISTDGGVSSGYNGVRPAFVVKMKNDGIMATEERFYQPDRDIESWKSSQFFTIN